jgi:hypothetical protein
MKVTADSMHRLTKLAMDSGEAATPEEAKDIFSRYQLCIYLGLGWASTLAGQAAFLTALNTAVRAFLGGVYVMGDIDEILDVPLYRGKRAVAIIPELGGQWIAEAPLEMPTIVIGQWDNHRTPLFCIQLGFNGWQAGCWGVNMPACLSCSVDNPLAGVAAAALGVNEAFLHVRGDLSAAGDRAIGISLWNPAAIEDWISKENCGPELAFLPASLWLIGLGHLGQAYAWTVGMLPYTKQFPHLVLQDRDEVTESNLSTCLLVSEQHIGQRKSRIIADCLESVGFTTDIIEKRFTEHHRVEMGEPTTALFGVDNVPARRAIDGAGFGLVIEAGLGSGYRDFRNIRIHVFPGPRRSTEIWSALDSVQHAVELSPVYEQMAEISSDRCGVTQLATRAVATPFVGALASSLVVGEIVRLLHGGSTYSTIDLQMKSLRHRTVVCSSKKEVIMPSFFSRNF